MCACALAMSLHTNWAIFLLLLQSCSPTRPFFFPEIYDPQNVHGLTSWCKDLGLNGRVKGGEKGRFCTYLGPTSCAVFFCSLDPCLKRIQDPSSGGIWLRCPVTILLVSFFLPLQTGCNWRPLRVGLVGGSNFRDAPNVVILRPLPLGRTGQGQAASTICSQAQTHADPV